MTAVAPQSGSPKVAPGPAGRRRAGARTVVRAGPARRLRRQRDVIRPVPHRRPGEHLVAAAEGGADVAGPARLHGDPHRWSGRTRQLQRLLLLRARTCERVPGLRWGRVGDAVVPQLRVQVLLQRVVEGVREPRGGLLAGEAAAARAVGGRRPLVHLRLRDDAPVVPQQLHEIAVRAADAIIRARANQHRGREPILEWTTRKSTSLGEGKLHDGLLLIRRRPRITNHVVTVLACPLPPWGNSVGKMSIFTDPKEDRQK
jgi:hypothetical protein